MGTQSDSTSVGGIPVLDGVVSLSDSVNMARHLRAAMEGFTKGDGFRTLSHLVDTIPQLEKGIRERDVQIEKLGAQLVADKASNSAHDQKQLENYNYAYDKWKGKETTLQMMVRGLQEEVKEKAAAIAALRSDMEASKANGRDLEARLKEKAAKLSGLEQENVDLGKQLHGAQDNVNAYSGKCSKLQDRVKKLEVSLEKNRTEHEKLKDEAAMTKDRLKEVIKLSAPLEDVNEGAL